MVLDSTSYTGNDTIYGGAGNDSIYGGQGDDYIDGGAGFFATLFCTTKLVTKHLSEMPVTAGA